MCTAHLMFHLVFSLYAACMFEGVEYQHHQNFRPSSKPCDVCICFNGIVSCRNTVRCPTTCSYGVFSDGECCSQCIGQSLVEQFIHMHYI